MKNWLKYWLWKLGLWGNNCPYCGNELMQHGFEPNERWSCNTEGCRFNENGESAKW